MSGNLFFPFFISNPYTHNGKNEKEMKGHKCHRKYILHPFSESVMFERAQQHFHPLDVKQASLPQEHYIHIHSNFSFLFCLLRSETKLSRSDKTVIGGNPAMATMEVMSDLFSCTVLLHDVNFKTIQHHRKGTCPSLSWYESLQPLRKEFEYKQTLNHIYQNELKS